ncbi:MAG: hypothetical protein P4L03_06660 [Terracidiphilus sp.]|nr:hypothetical protein [Terracidiphilus sp.]
MSAPYDPSLAAQGGWQWYRPMTLGQTLDRIFQLIRKNLKLFIAIGLVPLASIVVFEAAYLGLIFRMSNPLHPQNPPAPSPELSAVVVLMMMALWVGMMLLYALFEAAANWAALQVDAAAQASVWAAWKHVGSKAGRYVWLAVLRLLVAAGPFLLAMLLLGISAAALQTVGGGHTSPGVLFLLVPLWILLLVGAIVYMVLAVVWLSLAYPASIAEDLPAWQAIRRSVAISHGTRGRIFLALLVVYAIAMTAILVVELAAFASFAIGALVMVSMHLPAVYGYAGIGIGVLVFLPLFVVAMALTSSAYAVTLSVIYRDQVRVAGMRAAFTPPAV